MQGFVFTARRLLEKKERGKRTSPRNDRGRTPRLGSTRLAARLRSAGEWVILASLGIDTTSRIEVQELHSGVTQ